MSYFLKSGNTFKVSSKEAMDLHDLLPPGNYVIKKDMYENLFLEQIDNFQISTKLYGDCLKHTGRILRTFGDRPNSTGVMLTGEKGSGKTLLAKNISIEAAKQGIPTIVINAAWRGDAFNSLLQAIEQPTIVLFDEFEKVYSVDDQEDMLTLLDGVFPSKKLFILTCNDKWRVNEHMRNRPGRIYYMLDFKGLTPEFIREYSMDNLKNKLHIERLVQIAGTFDQFNFDMLKATVEEMNRFNETPQEAMSILNTKPEFGGKNKYTVKLVKDGFEMPEKLMGTTEWQGNPLSQGIAIHYKAKATDEEWEWEDIDFSPSDLKKIDGDGSRYTFVRDDGNRIVLTRLQEKNVMYWDAF